MYQEQWLSKFLVSGPLYILKKYWAAQRVGDLYLSVLTVLEFQAKNFKVFIAH